MKLNKRIIILLIVMSCVITVGCSFGSKERELRGSWQTYIDVSDMVIPAIEAWLSEAYRGEKVSVEDYANNICIAATLSFDDDGTFTLLLDKDGIQGARDAAMQALTDSYVGFMNERFTAAGQSELTKEEIEKMMMESFGVSVSEYLAQYGPDLLPEDGVLCDELEMSGEYTTDNDTICLEYGDVSETVYFICDKEHLVFTGTVSGNGITFIELPMVLDKEAK